MTIYKIFLLVCLISLISSTVYSVQISDRDSLPLLSYFIQNNTIYKQVFNPTWVPTSPTYPRKGLLIRTQDCQYNIDNTCVFCGGGAEKASLLTFS
jgi:hypothetical protein